jgi:hypothetical protein
MRSIALWASFVALLGLACTARIDGGAPAGGTPVPPGTDPNQVAPNLPLPAETTGAAPIGIRRLTPTELARSVADIFFDGDVAFNGDPAGRQVPRHPFQDEAGPHDFDNVSSGLGVSLAFAEQLQKFAEDAAARIEVRLPQLVACSAAPADETACVTEFIDRYATRVYRRPVQAHERGSLLQVFIEARTSSSFAGAVGAIAEAMLQSPLFLFRTEYATGASKAAMVPLGSHEIAAAMSYFLWRSTPPEWLEAQARDGALSTTAGIEAAASKLLEDPRAHFAVADFFAQFLEVRRAPGIAKDHPGFTPTLAASSLLEVERFVDFGVWQENATFAQLLAKPVSFVNAELAAVYGLLGSAAPTSTELVPTALDPTRRAGLLTQPAFLMVHSSPGSFSPIFLGHFVRSKLLCQALPPPPPGVPELPAEPGLSTRERFSQHASAACAGCHSLMDPIGFSFERYDQIGAYRETEQLEGREVSLSGAGELLGTDVDGPFSGPVELAAKLGQSASVDRCFLSQLFKFALGRELTFQEFQLAIDQRSLDTALTSAGQFASLKRQLALVVASDSFLFRDATTRPD